MRRIRPKPSRTDLVGLVAWTVLLLVTLLNSVGLQVLDIKPEIYLAPDRMRTFFLQAWQPSPQVGFPSFNVGLAPVAWLVSGLHALGLGALMAVRVLRLLLYTIGAFGTARLYRRLRELGPRAGRVSDQQLHFGALVAAIAYVANPYAVVGGSTLAVLLPYALLPWQTLCLVRCLEDRHSWRWPAGFALSLAAMSGMNAGVVPLLQMISVPVVVLVVRRSLGLRWRQLLLPVTRCAVLSIAVSMYWIVPALYALSEGQAVLDNSETLQGINGPSSFSEVLRGLGFWPNYGSGDGIPWVPGFASYLNKPIVVAFSFGCPVAVAWAVAVTRGPIRRLAIGLVAVAAVVMVGLYPYDHPSPAGRVLRWLFTHSAALGSLRTTNKAGAVLVLGGSLVVALAVSAFWATRPPGQKAALGVAGLVVLVGGAYPAFANGLYPRTFDIPDYWHDAATAIDAGPADQRVWLVPGEVQPQYRWAAPSPDDVALPLFSRPTVVRTTLPVASPYSANFLAAADTQLQRGTLAPGALSTLARYLGVGDVLVRNDLAWEQNLGARPWTVHEQVTSDPGLKPAGEYGAPGEDTASPLVAYSPAEEGQLTPIEDYRVLGPTPMVRAESLDGSVVLDGDNFALAPVAQVGLLTKQPDVRLAGDLTTQELVALLGPTHRLVLTDSNRRTDTVLGWLAANQGPLLGASVLPASTRALFDPADQTTLQVDGGATVTASMVGSTFGTLAEAVPENAFDGDDATSWQFGDFGTAVGQHLDATLAAPRRVTAVTIQQAPIGPVRIAQVRVVFGGVTKDVTLPDTGSVTVPLGVSGSRFSVTVLTTKGSGYNRVGISEINLGGLRLTRVAKMPEGLDRLAAAIPDQDRAALQKTPLDIVLDRARGAEGSLDDEETSIQRDFVLPDARTYSTYGWVRPGKGLTETDYDKLAGIVGSVHATSTSQALGLPLFRASLAADGDPNTAWVPAEPIVGQSITVTFPATTLDHVDVTQAPIVGTTLDGWATKVGISLDGGEVTEATVGPGTVTVPVPTTTATTLTLTVLGRSTPAKTVRISEIGIGDRHVTFSAAAAERACITVATVDGEPVRVHPLEPILGLDTEPYGPCPQAPTLALAGGQHALRSDGRWVADTLALRDVQGGSVATPGVVPRLGIHRGGGSSLTIHAAASTQPWVLVTGQSHDPGWVASSGGKSLGRSIVADGYSAGWIVPAGPAQTISVSYGPQRASSIALVGSLSAAALCLLLLVVPRRRRRRPEHQQTAPEQPAGRVRGPRTAGFVWRVAAAAATVAIAWFCADWTGAVTAAVAVLGLASGLRAVTLTYGAVVVMATVPVVWIAGNRDRMPTVSVDLVQQVSWAGHLAAAALVLLVIGALAERRADGWQTPPS